MAIGLHELQQYIQHLLDVDAFDDYCPNGLQVEACEQVQRVVTGVTASEALIDAAIARKADVLLVHHGYFWKGEAQPLTGMKGRRVRKLMQNNISLLAYHLPLDAHPELGNNAQLGQLLGLQVSAGLDTSPRPVGLVGQLQQPLTLAEFSADIALQLQREPLLIGDEMQTVSRVAWCTGAAQSYIEKAAAAGADCFISGEISEPTVHAARELGIAYIAAGHHATERYGVKALGEHLAQQFGLVCEFVDIPNPV